MTFARYSIRGKIIEIDCFAGNVCIVISGEIAAAYPLHMVKWGSLEIARVVSAIYDSETPSEAELKAFQEEVVKFVHIIRGVYEVESGPQI